MTTSEKMLVHAGEAQCALKDSLSFSTASDSNYVDLNELLDIKLNDGRAVGVSFAGEPDRLAFIKSTQELKSADVIQCVRFPSAASLPAVPRKCVNVDRRGGSRKEDSTEPKTKSLDEPEISRGKSPHFPDSSNELIEENLENSECDIELIDGCTTWNLRNDSCESEKSDSNDEVSLLITDYCVREETDDEAHYITTHEIQLSELDHDVDSDIASPCSWDINDDNQVYSFVDYASFDSDETVGGQVNTSSTAEVTCNQTESDLLQTAESAEKSPKSENQSAGHIHLSITATSRAINDLSNVQEKDGDIHHAKHAKNISRCVIRDSKGEKIGDGTKCLIALPGRLHFGSKCKGKDVTGYSSGTSSAVSELDDADKEVRNLTARTFRSLAHPYLGAINFSTSSESSASEASRGLNSWSALVGVKYSKVNVSKARDHALVIDKNAASNVKMAKRNNGITGLTLTSRRAPPVEIFALNGSLVNPRNATSTKKIALMGKFGQSSSGVIRLTETLNIHCNVKANEKRAKSARCAKGSRSADEVTNALPGARNGPACNSEEAMEDSHKKSIFASSLLKNVISKKMQFEQERKMERGEICEPCGAPSPSSAAPEPQSQPALHTLSSRVSETGSDFTIVCLDELGDIVDSRSCNQKDDNCSKETFSGALETDLEATPGALFDAKKEEAETSRSVLIQSQNSAFRSWRDDEPDMQTERKNQLISPDSRLTKMSSLFVPSIQKFSGDRELTRTEPGTKYDTKEEETAINNNLCVSDSGQNAKAPRLPEIKISLRSLKDTRSEPLSLAKTLTPSVSCNAGALVKIRDESKYQSLTGASKNDSDRIPHFTVRDMRDKSKPQAPIHQVRDVRKLVKSSYHFVSLDKKEKDLEHKISKQHRNSSPIVIKCHSVNTNCNVKQTKNRAESCKERLVEEIHDPDVSYFTAPTGDFRSNGAHTSNPTTQSANTNHYGSALRIETRTTSKRHDKAFHTGEETDSKLVAIKKLQAAVKTMEQLYTFDKKEWRRKSEPHPITDSHVLSLITNKTHQRPEQEHANGLSFNTKTSDPYPMIDKMHSAGQQPTLNQDKEIIQMRISSVKHEKLKDSKTPMHHGVTPKTSISNRSQSHKSSVPITSSVKSLQINNSPHLSLSYKAVTPKSPRLPVSVKITKSKSAMEHREQTHCNDADIGPVQFKSLADSDNYLTLPVKPQAIAATPSHLSDTTKISEVNYKSSKRTSIAMKTHSPDNPTATIYHQPFPITMQAAQPQVICFSPTVQTPPVPIDHFQTTQRKMLLDPTTGSYYLVDTPVQPATKRLFDPQTGQYVDVPMPQQPPMTPVPMSISPLALSPGGYGQTYMIYPGYMAATVIPAPSIETQLSMQSEVEAEDKAYAAQKREEAFMESPYYMASRKSMQSALGVQHVTGKSVNSNVPVISITSQQGPKIIAPPSFDGTTMSFVVEHR